MTSFSPSASAAPPPHATREDSLYRWFFPLLGVASLLISCVILSVKKQEWADEIFSRVELSDRSLPHLMSALTRLGGAGMPLFSLTAWPWAHLFGLSDLSLRLYSSAGMCAAFLVLHAALRRRFSARASFLGVAFGFFACLVIIDQNAEARGYGLYMLLCAMAIAQLLRIAETPNPSPRALILLALSQAGVVLGHVLGIFFAGLMVLALLLAELPSRRLRWKVYFCAMAGWMALLPWLPAIRASLAVGKPHGWIPVPGLGELLIGVSWWLFAGIYFPLTRGTTAGVVTGWFCAVFCIAGIVVAGVYALRAAAPQRRALYWLGFTLLVAPIAFFVLSHLVTPIWVARYMIPSSLGMAILAASWADRNRGTAGVVGIGLSLVLLAMPIATAALEKCERLDVARIDQVAAGRPVVCDWIRDFTVAYRYSAHPDEMQFPLDWPAALKGPSAAVGAYHLMVNYRRDGYMSGSIVDVDSILSRSSFLVLDSSETNWFQVEIASDPRFIWKVLAQIDAKRRMIEVDRRP
ncbi:MAG TPA: hypothetical protein VHX60_07760 [Acidobacteriaceae bacterium]|jgi:hypothetical protein|nr:hypothetical protein [Acidobacteriaceae bacterium]